MRIRGYVAVVGANALALTLFALPVVQGKAKSGPLQAPESSQPAKPDSEACGSARLSENNFKTITGELASKMAEIKRQVAREVSEMEPDRLARLEAVKAAMASAQKEIQSNQSEIEQRAAEIASQVEPDDGERKVWIEAGEESGWLGVEISEVTAEKAKELNLPAIRGVLVTEVEADSPAAKRA